MVKRLNATSIISDCCWELNITSLRLGLLCELNKGSEACYTRMVEEGREHSHPLPWVSQNEKEKNIFFNPHKLIVMGWQSCRISDQDFCFSSSFIIAFASEKMFIISALPCFFPCIFTKVKYSVIMTVNKHHNKGLTIGNKSWCHSLPIYRWASTFCSKCDDCTFLG